MGNALIGFSGFVGSTLCAQTNFDFLYNSKNIHEIKGKSFDTVVCSGAYAKKWLANLEPESDKQNIINLIHHLKTIQCAKFILISTIDVFKHYNKVDENTPIDETGLHSYGMHRRLLEKFVESYFPNSLIIRLAGLVGTGLRKNVIFDFLNNNNLSAIDCRGVFQFYPMIHLWEDIQIALKANLKLVHLVAEPVCVSDVAKVFKKEFHNCLGSPPAYYNVLTAHAKIFGASVYYQYTAQDSLKSIQRYAQYENISNM